MQTMCLVKMSEVRLQFVYFTCFYFSLEKQYYVKIVFFFFFFLFFLIEQVSYSLLIFFCGMFITVEGFNKTGIPSTLWDAIEPYAKIDRTRGIAILALVVLALSNLASNVPTGMVLVCLLFT